MVEQFIMRLKGRLWVLILLTTAAVVLAVCSPTPTPKFTGVVVTPTPLPPEVVVLELAEVIETPVSVEVENRQPLKLDVVDSKGRLHFRLEIGTDAYPLGNDFKLEVTAIPSETIAKICWGQKVCKEYPEVSGVKDGRLIIRVDSTEYVTASPYAFSVTGIDKFERPVSASISVDIPPGEITQPHGIIIYHEDDGTIEHFSAKLDEDDNGFLLLVANPDDSDKPIYHCCRMDGH